MSARSSDAAGSASAGRLRARDIDRVNARARIDAAYEEGQLGADEYEQRSQRAQTAQTLEQLARLVGDLQPGKTETRVAAPPTRQAEVSRYPTRTRARDSDRAATCLLLDAGLADGQLNEGDHRALTDLAGEARTVGELAELTADLQRSVNAPAVAQPPRSYRGQLFGWGVLAACAALFVAGFAAVNRPAPIPAAPAGVQMGTVAPIVLSIPKLHTGEGISAFIAQYKAKFGDLSVDDLNLYADYAILKRMVPGQPNRQVDYDYRGGFVADSAPTTRKTDAPVFDLGAIDTAALGKLLVSAPGDLKVAQGEISHIGFEPDQMPPTRGGPPTPIVRIYVSNKVNESGFLEATPTGVVTRSYPFGR
ncbi:DUF1707 domain-containing protein [Nocardia sp. NBC_01503]|uniref:DUF1707 SHOCT-like domain-containing protein n=1 Tax=Nocardia sp. NBC_01503 TaxID=2975997 RepID=UPI002E7B3021|nr:DUF1707 domain-containing protein [Nocardia sp. NBC_01503]WTL34997.1 DUF1707 domain-containing protein [Nocardia sp. NBC_01503]